MWIKLLMYLVVIKVILNLSVIYDLSSNLIFLDLVLKAHSLPLIRKGNEEIAYNFIDSRLASELRKFSQNQAGVTQLGLGPPELSCLEYGILASLIASYLKYLSSVLADKTFSVRSEMIRKCSLIEFFFDHSVGVS